MQIRTVTREAVSQWSEAARIEGKDLGEVLDRAGVLLTPERLAAIRANLLNQMAQVLEETPTSHFIGARHMPANDYQVVVAKFLRSEASNEIEKSTKR